MSVETQPLQAVLTVGRVAVDQIEAGILQGTYPDYSKVIPPNESLKKPGQFGFYQSKCIKIIEELEAAFEVCPIFHRPNKKGTPLKATFSAGSGERVIACVMPKSVRTTETYAAMKACI